MSERDVEIVRSAMEEYTRTGEPVWDLTHDDVEVYDHDIMDGGSYQGRDGVYRWLADWASPWSDFSVEPEEFIDGGDAVIAVVRMRAKGASSGIEVDRQDAILCRLRDGKIARMDYFNNLAQARQAAGLD